MLKRYWIDQPSTLQPLHHLDGTNVIVDDRELQNVTCTVAPVSGDIITMQVPRIALSKGWTKRILAK